jgi:hypothetical protein
MMEERIVNIQKAAGSDPEQLVAPKELWFSGSESELDEWFKSRESRRGELTQKEPEYLR